MQIPQWVQDRVIARQGCLHPYDSLPGARTAVVVIDPVAQRGDFHACLLTATAHAGGHGYPGTRRRKRPRHPGLRQCNIGL